MIMRPMHQAMDGREFRNFMETFLRFAGNGLGKVFNFAWSLGMSIGPIVALVFLRDDLGSRRSSSPRSAWGLCLSGLVVSNVWKTPTYNVILAWDPDALPPDWETGRRSYFTINWLIGDDLGGVRAVPGGPDLPLRCRTSQRVRRG